MNFKRKTMLNSKPLKTVYSAKADSLNLHNKDAQTSSFSPGSFSFSF